jgi:hypothetical protein
MLPCRQHARFATLTLILPFPLPKESLMPEQPLPGEPPPPRIKDTLLAIAQVLREVHPLTLEAQQALAGELGHSLALAVVPVPPEELTHLAESTAQMVQLVHRRASPGLLASARDRLEQAILSAEAQSPLSAGLARRLLDALANIGI